MTDLARLEFRCRWEHAAPPTHPGRALHAWWYGLLARHDQRLADSLHDGDGPRPFALALAPAAAGTLHLVIGAGPGLAPLLPALAGRLLSDGRLLLDGRWLLVEEPPTSHTETFAALVGRHLVAAARPVPVRLHFRTPTTFHSRGRSLPLPVPDVLFLSLLQRWYAWGGLDLGPEAEATITQAAALRRHRLQSVTVPMEGRFAAFVGTGEFTLVRPDPAYAGLLAALGAFAEFAGAGQKTAMGLGCVQAQVLAPPPHRQDCVPNPRPTAQEVPHP